MMFIIVLLPEPGRADDRDELALGRPRARRRAGRRPGPLHRVGPADPVEADDRGRQSGLSAAARKPPPAAATRDHEPAAAAAGPGRRPLGAARAGDDDLAGRSGRT